LGTSDFSPWHGALPRIFANPKESQPAEITHCFFSQALRKIVQEAERLRIPHGVELKAPGSRINPQRRHQA
jgi:hypothetical protein